MSLLSVVSRANKLVCLANRGNNKTFSWRLTAALVASLASLVCFVPSTQAQSNEYLFEPGLTNLHLLDSKTTGTTHGMVLSKTGTYLGTYVNPFSPSSGDSKVKSLMDSLLFKSVQETVFQLQGQAQRNIKITLGVRKDVNNAIAAFNIANQMAGYLTNLYKGNVKNIAVDFVNNYFLLIDQSLGCQNTSGLIPNTGKMRTPYQNHICSILKDPMFNYAKDSMNAIIGKAIDVGFKNIFKFTASDIVSLTDKLNNVFIVFDITLKASAIITDVASTFSINNATDKYYMGIMLNDFTQAYEFFDQDIDKFSDFIIKQAKQHSYPLPADVSANGKFSNFTQLFFHYVQLRRNTSFGKYYFFRGKEVSGSSNTMASVKNMAVAPAAAAIMLREIEQFGNGGNLLMKVTPVLENGSKSYKFEMAKDKINPLYTVPPRGTYAYSSSLFSTNSTLSFKASLQSGTCNASRMLIGTPAKYNVFFGGATVVKPLNSYTVNVGCTYKYNAFLKNNRNSVSSMLLTVFIPEWFPDVSVTSWSVKPILALLQQGVINGYPDGAFKPKNNVTVGEVLKMVSIGLYGKVYKNDGYGSYVFKNLGTPFGEYVDFLMTGRKIDISPLNGGTTNSSMKLGLNLNATRGYVAKLINNILAKEMLPTSPLKFTAQTTCGARDALGWDACSKELRAFGISRGSEITTGPLPHPYVYNPNNNITRDEFSKILVKTQSVAKDLQTGAYPSASSNYYDWGGK